MLTYISFFQGWTIDIYIYLLIVGVTVFFICKWTLKKLFKVNSKVLITISSAMVVLLGVLLFGIGYYPGKPFNRENWMKDEFNRYHMATDIIRSKMLMDKDSNQVRQVLGDPGGRSDSTYLPGYRNSWFYNMGSGPYGLGVAFHILVVRFDQSKVITVDHSKTID